jgi:hypothetical protein
MVGSLRSTFRRKYRTVSSASLDSKPSCCSDCLTVIMIAHCTLMTSTRSLKRDSLWPSNKRVSGKTWALTAEGLLSRIGSCSNLMKDRATTAVDDMSIELLVLTGLSLGMMMMFI